MQYYSTLHIYIVYNPIHITTKRMKRIRNIGVVAILMMVQLLTLSLMSCQIDDNQSSFNDNFTTCPETPVAYEGKWTVGSMSVSTGKAIVSGKEIQLFEVPYTEILQQLFQGSNIESGIGCNNKSEKLKFTVTQASDKTLLYSLEPTEWHLSALVDKKPYSVNIALSPNDPLDNTTISWGTLSMSGVLTLVLHATSYTVNSGDINPVSLKLVFTAKRK